MDRPSFNPFMINGSSHPYHLDESTFIFRRFGISSFLFYLSTKFMSTNRILPDGTAQKKAVSHLGLFCLPMSHKKDARLLWAKYSCLKQGVQHFSCIV